MGGNLDSPIVYIALVVVVLGVVFAVRIATGYRELSGVAAVARPAAAQEAAAGDLANHPLVGTWAVQTPGGVVPQIHGPDGSVIVAFPPFLPWEKLLVITFADN